MTRRCRLPVLVLVAGLAVNTSLLFYILYSQSQAVDPYHAPADPLPPPVSSESSNSARVTFVLADFEDFLNDISDTAGNISVRFPRSRVVVLAGTAPYPPLKLPGGVSLILDDPLPHPAAPLALSDTRPESFLRTEYVAFVPDGARASAHLDVEGMLEVLSAGRALDPAVTMAAWPLTPRGSRCLRLRVDLRRWTITYSSLVNNSSRSDKNIRLGGSDPRTGKNLVDRGDDFVGRGADSVAGGQDQSVRSKYRRCDALDQGEHVLLMPTAVLLRFTRPFLRPFSETLFIENALAGGRVVVVDVTQGKRGIEGKHGRVRSGRDFKRNGADDRKKDEVGGMTDSENMGDKINSEVKKENELLKDDLRSKNLVWASVKFQKNLGDDKGRDKGNDKEGVEGWFRERDLFAVDAHVRWKKKEAQRRWMKEAYAVLGIKLVRWIEESNKTSTYSTSLDADVPRPAPAASPVVREAWHGCTPSTPRCFPSVLASSPSYLAQGRWTPPCCLRALRETARYTLATLAKAGVRHWLEGGSLLGAARAGDIIPWDYDVDVGMYREDVSRSVHLVRAAEEPDGFEDEEGYVWELAREGGFYRVQRSRANRLHVDIFPFYTRNGTMTKDTWILSHRQDTEFSEAYLRPIETIRFVGVEAGAPNRVREFLEEKFGRGVVEDPRYPDDRRVL